jgi:hypothetical protein
LAILGESFRSFRARLLPGAIGGKPSCLLAVVILAGCGGGGGGKTQVVRGDGFTFEAPADWKVKGTAATDGNVDRLEVLTFKLVKRYRPQLFTLAAKELDNIAAQLAAQLHGKVTSRETTTAAGGNARSYRIEYDGKTTQVTFVLDGRREYQLLCRRKSDASDRVCKRLVRTFRLR